MEDIRSVGREGAMMSKLPTFRISKLVCKIACPVSSVIITDIIQTVLETSVFFLSNINYNMHILAN
jgi:hypothetical protein